MYLALRGYHDYEDTPVSGELSTYAQMARNVQAARGYWGVTNVIPADQRREEIVGYPFVTKPPMREAIASLARAARENGVPMMIRFGPVPMEGGQPSRDGLRSWSSDLQQSCPSRHHQPAGNVALQPLAVFRPVAHQSERCGRHDPLSGPKYH